MRLVFLFLTTFGLLSPLIAQKKQPASNTLKPVDWQKEEMCQFVFFAVLEGLYRDGIQNEVVDAIIGAQIPKKENKVKTHFVLRCKLCHATYEAFRTYRNRPNFSQANGVSTFGEIKNSSSLIKKLQSKDAQTRIYAMGDLVRPWISKRIELTRKTPAEKSAMRKKLIKYAQEGDALLNAHKKAKDGFYLDWSFYGSCQACEAAKDLGQAGF